MAKKKTKSKPNKKTSAQTMQDMHKSMGNKHMMTKGSMSTQFKMQKSSRGK